MSDMYSWQQVAKVIREFFGMGDMAEEILRIRDENAALRAENTALTAERDRLRDEGERRVQTLVDFMTGKVSVKDIMVREGRMDIVMHTEMASVVADSLAAMLDDTKAENYVEMQMRGSNRKEYTVLVRRHEKPTPHELRMQAVAERDRALSILAALREPSEGVLMGAHQQLRGIFPGDMWRAIRAAVAAAEQEVGRE